MKVDFNKPYFNNNQGKYLIDASKMQTNYVEKVTKIFQEEFQVEDVFLTNSASNALELVLLALDLPKGSEIILPSYTYPAICNSIVRYGYKLVLCDSNRLTLTVETKDIIDKISKKTSCVIPCHYGGATCNMDKLMEICNERGIKVIEDAATSFGAKYKDKHLGTIGHVGVISFDKTKNISCEKGGVLLLNNVDSEVKEKLHYLYENGTDRFDFLRGVVTNYSWKVAGLSVQISNIHCALLLAQLESRDEIYTKREKLYKHYEKKLRDVCINNHWRLPRVESHNINNYHVFYMVLDNNAQREKLRTYLLSKEIVAQTHYQPLHTSSMGKSLGYHFSDFPNTNHIANCVLRLPLHPTLTIQQVNYVIESIKEFAL